MDNRLQVTLANDLEEVTRLAALTEEFLEAHAVDLGHVFKVNVALDEVLTNIITHGLEDRADAVITVDMQMQDGTLTIIVSDPGPAFDPLQEVAPASLNADIEDRPIGGLGIFLVRKFMDTCRYQREGHLNQLIMAKKVDGPVTHETGEA